MSDDTERETKKKVSLRNEKIQFFHPDSVTAIFAYSNSDIFQMRW